MFHLLILALFATAEAAPHVADTNQFAAIPGKYIVKFKEHMVASASLELKNSLANRPDHDYSMRDFTGFAGTVSADEVQRLQASGLVSNSV